jgi:hypothetical protein
MVLELFVAATLLYTGEIVFGRFEEGTPRARRMGKRVLFIGGTALCSALGGRTAALAWIVGALALGLGVHGWWTRTHGIGFWTPEPWDRYRGLRGWSR